MNLAVLLLHCNDTDQTRAATGMNFTRFTRGWAERAIERVAQYFLVQSGGRQTISYKVFDWIPLAKTEQEWVDFGFAAFDALRKEIEEHVGDDLSPFAHILIGIDHTQSRGGTTFGAENHSVTYLAASNFTPSFIAHELGHRFHPRWPAVVTPDAFRETAAGEAIYENRFCVMGALGWPAVFADEAIADPTEQMLNMSGPGMSAPTLLATGWLKSDAHGAGVELSDNNLYSGGVVQQLSALTGAPGPSWNRPPVMIRYRDLVLEYRVRGSYGWDRGLPHPGDGAGGWVVVHRCDQNTPRALYVDSVAARPGAVLMLGNDDPFNLFNPGPIKISILSFDAAASTVHLGLTRRAARPLPSVTTYGGVDVGGGGLVWTPGRGLIPIPPRSPLMSVLNQLIKIQALQEMMNIVPDYEMDRLSREATDALGELQRSVSGLHVEPIMSPLAQALENVSRLHSTSVAISSESSPESGETTRGFIEASRKQLAEVREILATAVDQERRQ